MKYGLMLNDMRFSNIENLICVKASENRQELVDYHDALLGEPYSDGKWGKRFKKGSELEWFNPSDNLKEDNYFWGGVYIFPDSSSLAEIWQYSLLKG